MKYLITIMLLNLAPLLRAELVRLYSRGIYEPGGRGRDSVMVFDVTQGGSDVVLIQLSAFDNDVEIELSPGTYSVSLATATKDGVSIGSSAMHTMVVSAGSDKLVTVYHDWVLQKPVVIDADVSAASGSSAEFPGALFVVLGVGFAFGWLLFSPLDV